MKYITLINGGRTKVDDNDYEMLSLFKWYGINSKRSAGTYVIAAKAAGIFMHRLIMMPPPLMVIDHKNGDSLDNRKSNLRICHHHENCQNSIYRNKTNKHGYTGLSQDHRKHLWRARISVNMKRLFLGVFKSPLAASRAYQKAVKKYHTRFVK